MMLPTKTPLKIRTPPLKTLPTALLLPHKPTLVLSPYKISLPKHPLKPQPNSYKYSKASKTHQLKPTLPLQRTPKTYPRPFQCPRRPKLQPSPHLRTKPLTTIWTLIRNNSHRHRHINHEDTTPQYFWTSSRHYGDG